MQKVISIPIEVHGEYPDLLCSLYCPQLVLASKTSLQWNTCKLFNARLKFSDHRLNDSDFSERCTQCKAYSQ